MVPDMQPANVLARMRKMLDDMGRLVEEGRSTARSLGSATIDKGDLLVKGGGGVRVQDGGGIYINAGTLRTRFLLLRAELFPGSLVFSNDLDGNNYVVGGIGGGEVGVSSTSAPIALRTESLSVSLAHDTTSSGANTYIDFVGRVWRVVSSKRYKQDPEAAVIDVNEVYSLEGMTWRDRSEVASDPDTTNRYSGVFAEDLHERPTLRQFVRYDDDGRPDAVDYDRFSTVALLAAVKDLNQRLSVQQSKLDAAGL